MHRFIALFIAYKSGLEFFSAQVRKFSANPGKLHFEVLVHILMYIRYNNTLGLKYYANINDAPVSDLLRQTSIKIKNQLMTCSNSSWKYFPNTVRSTGANIIYCIKLSQLTMAHMFQDQLLNQVHKLRTMQHALQEWL